VTADFELSPRDAVGQRALTVEAFRRRGIHPEGVSSLADVSLVWDAPEGKLPLFPNEIVKDLASAAREFARAGAGPQVVKGAVSSGRRYTPLLLDYATDNAKKLHLDPNLKISVTGFHSSYRVAPDGQLLIDIVAQFEQCLENTKDAFGGSPLRGGTTVVASADRVVRYVIAKPLESAASTPLKRREAKLRSERQREFVEECDGADPQSAWCADRSDYPTRMLRMHNFASLHSSRG
jgi:hypothetical protein